MQENIDGIFKKTEKCHSGDSETNSRYKPEKPDYSGYFGTPEGIRTPDTRLRRAVLCPAELLARVQFLFVSVTPAVENPPNVRRRPLYPTELRGLIQKIFTFTGLQDSNDSIFRRRPLYTTELQGQIQYENKKRTFTRSYFTTRGEQCQFEFQKIKKELAFLAFSWYHNLCVLEGGVTYAEHQIC